MPRPVSISDSQILDAARQVFLERGIRATTSEVAARAGVSEGILFKRFASKDQLFRCAMELPRNPYEAPWLNKLPSRVGKTTIAEQFEEIVREAIQFFHRIVPLAMMSWSNAPPGGIPAHLDVPEPAPTITKRLLSEYFAAEQRIGRLRKVNPDLLARVFIGTVFNYVWHELMSRGRDPSPLSEDDLATGMVELLLTGAGAPAAKTESPRAKARPKAPAANKVRSAAKELTKTKASVRAAKQRPGDKVR